MNIKVAYIDDNGAAAEQNEDECFAFRGVSASEVADWLIACFGLENTDMQIGFLLCEAAFCRRIAAMMLARAEQIDASESRDAPAMPRLRVVSLDR